MLMFGKAMTSQCRMLSTYLAMESDTMATLMALPLRKKMHCRKQFLRTASEYSANTLRLLGKHNLIWLTSIRGMFAR